MADLVRTEGDTTEGTSRACDDLVVVAEFRDAIYPGLVSTGRVERGETKPFHTVINAENYHALQALLYTHEGKVDAIYIDPPYNSGARDWKYNNDYVDPTDAYTHSKWLAFIERRLLLAKKLLKPECSTLVITIDEKEFLRLGLLLEQTFPHAAIQMVTSVISAKGAVRTGKFSRVEEHIFFVTFGDSKIRPWTQNMLNAGGEAEVGEDPVDPEEQATEPIAWLGLRRREPSSVRGARPNQFYPIFVNADDLTSLHSVGDPVDDAVDRTTVPVPSGTVAIWPLKPDGKEMLWGLTPEVLRRNWAEGYARVSPRGTVKYLPTGTIDRIRSGEITITGRAPDGAVEGFLSPDSEVSTPPKRVWHMSSHNAETGGTNMLTALVPHRRFDYPKSLYAVEDTLRFIVGDHPEAVVLDFFAGSGTTTHAVARLNRQDGGRRRSILVTNNEVSADEEKRLREEGLRPGDARWESLGICECVTKPRLRAAFEGKLGDGTPIKGEYRFTDVFPMADGFNENVEFFTMTYEAPRPVAHNRSFEAIAPLLWMKAGTTGRRIDRIRGDFDVADAYGVLFDLDTAGAFLDAVRQAESVRMAFIVTDDERGFQAVCRELPRHVEGVRLYESYLTNFAISVGVV